MDAGDVVPMPTLPVKLGLSSGAKLLFAQSLIVLKSLFTCVASAVVPFENVYG